MALQDVQANPPNLILMDIKMPDLSGYEVCDSLKKIESARNIPIIFVSAIDDVNDKIKAFKMGGVDYITKPFQVKEVLARVEYQLALQNANQATRQFNAELENRVQERTAELEAQIQHSQKITKRT